LRGTCFFRILIACPCIPWKISLSLSDSRTLSQRTASILPHCSHLMGFQKNLAAGKVPGHSQSRPFPLSCLLSESQPAARVGLQRSVRGNPHKRRSVDGIPNVRTRLVGFRARRSSGVGLASVRIQELRPHVLHAQLTVSSPCSSASLFSLPLRLDAFSPTT